MPATPTPTQLPPLLVPHRFCGPARSGNGGWTAGALAAYVAVPGAGVPGAVEVRLHTPPPLDTPLQVTLTDDGARAVREDVVVATATRATREVPAVEAVGPDAARAAEASFAGLESHPFPTCFSCGTAREPGDGLRIFPGRIDDDSAGRVRVAATWTPSADADLASDGRATLATTWAALDCVGGWAGDLTERLMVLGSMTAHVLDLPHTGEPHVVVGGARGTSGRRTSTAATLYDAAGRALASAEHLWFAVDPKDFS